MTISTIDLTIAINAINKVYNVIHSIWSSLSCVSKIIDTNGPTMKITDNAPIKFKNPTVDALMFIYYPSWLKQRKC